MNLTQQSWPITHSLTKWPKGPRGQKDQKGNNKTDQKQNF